MTEKKQAWVEETPENIEELKKQASNKADYKIRMQAVDGLSKFKCRQSIDVLWRVMISDLVFGVKEKAFRALQSFGEDVKLPRKKKGHLIKDINHKLSVVGNSFNGDFNMDEFKRRFKDKYPEAYDVYLYEKKGNFDEWILNVLKSANSKR
ncbi:HEAT repeat domain-containing protein [Aeromonas salmonicida]|uniref:HEAT repeat domain-containing protein n=1 Tax=Aeromonas salmonicida TaxID=645 RepID=UPI00309CECCD